MMSKPISLTREQAHRVGDPYAGKCKEWEQSDES